MPAIRNAPAPSVVPFMYWPAWRASMPGARDRAAAVGVEHAPLQDGAAGRARSAGRERSRRRRRGCPAGRRGDSAVAAGRSAPARSGKPCPTGRGATPPSGAADSPASTRLRRRPRSRCAAPASGWCPRAGGAGVAACLAALGGSLLARRRRGRVPRFPQRPGARLHPAAAATGRCHGRRIPRRASFDARRSGGARPGVASRRRRRGRRRRRRP